MATSASRGFRSFFSKAAMPPPALIPSPSRIQQLSDGFSNSANKATKLPFGKMTGLAILMGGAFSVWKVYGHYVENAANNTSKSVAELIKLSIAAKSLELKQTFTSQGGKLGQAISGYYKNFSQKSPKKLANETVVG